MTHKRLFSLSLASAPGRLHMAAHSHHLWPDASREGQMACWDDAARLADGKWDHVMGPIWQRASAEVAEELGMGADRHDRIVFAANTHDLLIRLAAACPRGEGDVLRILTTDGEFHSARRQFARWHEEGSANIDAMPVQPVETLAERLADAASSGAYDMVLASHVLFGSGLVINPLEPLVQCARPEGPWIVIDGYHAFMAIDRPFDAAMSDRAFYLGGGYKYAMAGEGMGFMSCPPGFGERPPITGWYAEFEDLSLPPGMIGYAKDAMRFMGATFDPSALYRFNANRQMLADEGLTTADISAKVAGLQSHLTEALSSTCFGEAKLLNPLDGASHARFLAFRHPDAARWCKALRQKNCIVDVRGEVIRLGLGLYHDEEDGERFVALVRELA